MLTAVLSVALLLSWGMSAAYVRRQQRLIAALRVCANERLQSLYRGCRVIARLQRRLHELERMQQFPEARA